VARVRDGDGIGVSGVQRLTLSPQEAADALGVSRDFFDEHVKPELRVVRRGRLVLVPAREREEWRRRLA